MKRLFIVTDLGGGDGGKGGVVHKLCTMEHAHTVIKAGGGQGSHGVRTSRGEAYNFSHFGCGTLEGTRTHISDRMVIDPMALLEEGKQLKYEFGLSGVFDSLTVDSNTLCSTPFHFIASRLRELARKDKPRGTIGTGIGEAYADAERIPDLALRVKEASAPYLKDLLESIRLEKLEELGDIISAVGNFLEADQPIAHELIAMLQNPRMVDKTLEVWKQFARDVKIVPSDYLGNEILSKDGTVVIECSHGVLTDRYYGFHPHTSKLRTLPDLILTMLDGTGYDGHVVKVGITRAYQIRHGAGPMVTEDPLLVDKLLPGSSKEENRWQGKVRVGPLDCVALRYAINVSGGPKAFDALAITWFDQIREFGSWLLCDRYNGADDPEFFTPDGEIKVHRDTGVPQLLRQKRLGELLNKCSPVVTRFDLPKACSRDAEIHLCRAVLEKRLDIPVRMISFGPTEDDKICL